MVLNKLTRKVEKVIDKADEALDKLDDKLFPREKTEEELVADEIYKMGRQVRKYYKNNKSWINVCLIVCATVVVTKLLRVI